MIYHAVNRYRGGWQTIAIWTPSDNQSCLALAEDVFWHHGHKPERVTWGDVTSQKNWKGTSADCVEHKDTAEQACQYADARRAREYERINQARKEYGLEPVEA